MAKFDIYVSEYAGNKAWADFAKAYGCVGDELSEVIQAVMGDSFSNWLESQLPALDEHSPNDILRDYPDGEIIIRTLIMRMP